MTAPTITVIEAERRALNVSETCRAANDMSATSFCGRHPVVADVLVACQSGHDGGFGLCDGHYRLLVYPPPGACGICTDCGTRVHLVAVVPR